ncbi:hypothetical protein [Bradyrhizobium japonicum]|uniref:hypothetical protein n=1 Tax=Bradyrhizobium japonicum TaxID=375 RepID=UPI001BA757CE|nr:hypothetical protein [Bradyrhizobium japonicum]MBR0913939.1 hypothetical protein [Bradyrhizobium japonicum]
MKSQPVKSEYRVFGHDDQPRGDQAHRQNAKALLRPVHGFSRDADRYELSERCAEEDIHGIAAVYNSHRLAAATAPRLNAPRERLSAIAQKIDELRQLIATMGDIERTMYGVAGQVKEVPRELFLRAKGDWLPRSSVEPRPDPQSKWLLQLSALGNLTRVALRIYNAKVGPDVGGRTNVHKELFNSPEYVLIRHGWDLFERFKPGEASSSETGVFHLFLQQIYEYATGNGANERGAPALLPKIKQMLKPLRKYATNLEHLKLAEELECKILDRLTNGASRKELKGLMRALEEATLMIDPDAASELRACTTRKRARSRTP